MNTGPTLTEMQKRIAGLLMLSFRTNYNSSKRKIKSSAILAKISARGITIGDSELRQIIGHIRRNDMLQPGFILSDNCGYWYSEDASEMERIWTAERRRAINIMANFQPLNARFKHLQNAENDMFLEK